MVRFVVDSICSAVNKLAQQQCQPAFSQYLTSAKAIGQNMAPDAAAVNVEEFFH